MYTENNNPTPALVNPLHLRFFCNSLCFDGIPPAHPHPLPLIIPDRAGRGFCLRIRAINYETTHHVNVYIPICGPTNHLIWSNLRIMSMRKITQTKHFIKRGSKLSLKGIYIRKYSYLIECQYTYSTAKGIRLHEVEFVWLRRWWWWRWWGWWWLWRLWLLFAIACYILIISSTTFTRYHVRHCCT